VLLHLDASLSTDRVSVAVYSLGSARSGDPTGVPTFVVNLMESPMRPGVSVRTATTAMAVGLFLCTLSLGEENGLRARLVAEAPEAWKEISQMASHLELKRITRSREGSKEWRSDWTYKVDGDNWLVDATYFKPDGTVDRQDVLCRNSRYAFQLRRASPDVPWLVHDFGATPNDGLENIFSQYYGDRSVMPQLGVGPDHLPRIFGKPSFVIKNVESRRQGTETLVDVSFEYDPPEAEKSKAWTRRGVVSLNPELDWVVQEYVVEIEYPNGDSQQRSAKNEIALTADGFPFLKRVESELNVEGKPAAFIGSQLEEFSLRDVPEGEFMLSAFGLPEIMQPAVYPRRRLWVVLLVAGMLCIGVGFLIYRRRSAAR